MKQILVLGLFGIGAYYFLSKKNLAKTAKFSFEKLSMNWKKKQINVFIGVKNSGDDSAVLKSLIGDLIINGDSIASVESFDTVKIAPRSKSVINLTLKPSLVGIFLQLKNFIQKNNNVKKIKASFQGSANLEGLNIPLNINLVG